MTDALAILVSCGLLIFVVLRAIKLDAKLPWFESGAQQQTEKPARHHGILSASSADPGRDPGRGRR